MVVIVMMMVGASFAFLLFGGFAFQFAHPTYRNGNLLIIKHLRIYNTVQIHLCVVGFNNLCTRIQVADNLLHTFHLIRRHFRHFVQQHNVTELYLLNQKVFNILIINVFAFEVVTAGKLALHT